jgi:hypothetical protein
MPVLASGLALGPSVVVAEEHTIAEAGGALTYTATWSIPAGSTVLNVIVRNTVLWTNGTSASLVVGDADDANGYVEATDLKAAPSADVNGAAQGLSSLLSLGASIGTYKGGAGKYYAAAGTITATVTTGAGAQTAGRTRILVVYTLPATPVPATSA